MGERIRNDFAIFTSKAIWAASKGSFAKEKPCFLKILQKKNNPEDFVHVYSGKTSSSDDSSSSGQW